MLKILSLSVCLSAMLFVPAHAETREATLSRVEKYLESLSTLKADFTQLDPQGEISGGEFLLKRPGKMRWQYAPVPVVMVSSGNFLRYYDSELDQISDVPLDDTLAGFLAQDDITFKSKAIKVLDASSKEGVLRVKIEQAGKPQDGNLTMEFVENPLKLRNLVLVDAEGKQTSISLSNARYGIPLADSLFVLKDTRLNRKRK